MIGYCGLVWRVGLGWFVVWCFGVVWVGMYCVVLGLVRTALGYATWVGLGFGGGAFWGWVAYGFGDVFGLAVVSAFDCDWFALLGRICVVVSLGLFGLLALWAGLASWLIVWWLFVDCRFVCCWLVVGLDYYWFGCWV